MKTIKRISTAMLAVAVLGGPAVSMAGGKGAGASLKTSSTDASLDATEIQDLEYMREEEKLARDVYRTLYGVWGLAVHDNISESEQVHTTQVADMLDKYRIPDPVVDDTIGVFVNQELAVLYGNLVAAGSVASLDALYVGAAIEEIDMIDLQRAIDETDNADIRNLYENLMRGSRNHLRAFVGQIEDLGIVYEAQYLSQDEVDSIVDSPLERGN